MPEAAPSEAANQLIAPLRREFIAEALDGALNQGSGAIRFLRRGEDVYAVQAMRRMFDFARQAAAQMKLLQKDNDES